MTDHTPSPGPEDRLAVMERQAKRDVPALPEPVAYQAKIERTGRWANLPEDWQAEECSSLETYRALFSKAQMQGLVIQLSEALDRADRAEKELVRLHGLCSLGVGCDQYGVCYADAHGKPENCGKPAPIVCDALSDARRIADHDKKLWLAAESRATTAETALESARKVIEQQKTALKPMADNVYNDNGDLTISGFGTISPDECRAAYFADRAARQWLSANPAKETT